MLGVATVVAVAYYGFLKNFSPDYQYFSDYLTGPKNFTQVEVTQDIYPMVTYSNIVLTMVALLVTDLLQYKPVIVFGNMALICAKIMLYFGNTVAHMQLAEMFYATSKASNLGYNTYIYTQIDKKNYQSVTAIVNISPKIGIMLSSLTGQILLFFQLASLENLLQINIVALILSLVLAFSLPSPNYTSDKDVEKSKSGPQTNQENSDSTCEKYKERIILLWKEFKSTYTNPYLLKWCIWMVISYGAIELVIHYYAQALWSEVSGSKQNVYNGLVDGIYMALSMTGVYIAGKVRVDWKNNVDIVLGLISVLKGAFILASSCSTSLFWCYVHYTIYAVTSDASLILYRAEMAQHLENFGLIFGINLFVAINIQSMLTFVLTSKKGLALAIRDQFSVIGWSFTVLGIVFLIKATYERLTSYGVTTTKQDTDKVESVNTHL